MRHAARRNLAATYAARAIHLGDGAGVCPALTLTPGLATPTALTPHQDERLDVLAGEVALAGGDLEQSQRWLGQVQADGDRRPPDLFWLGCVAFKRGETGQAIAAWRAAGALDYFVIHGDASVAAGEVDNALGLYAIAVQIAPDSAEAWLGMAVSLQHLALRRQADWEQMLEAADRALALAPDEPQAHYLVGYALWFLRREPVRAERELRWAVEHRNSWLDAYSLAGLLLDQGRAGEPTQLLEHALALQDIPLVRGQLMRAYLAEGRCAEAQREYVAAAQQSPAMLDQLEAIWRAYPFAGCARP